MAANSHDTSRLDEDPEDVLSTSLDTLYDYQPITLSSAGSHFVYELKNTITSLTAESKQPQCITCRVPDTQASNWSLHASSVWTASVFLADHLSELHLEDHLLHSPSKNIHVLELGAGAGLPGIAIARIYKDADIHVTSSDYPDAQLISALKENVRSNDVSSRCSVVPYAWGSDPSALLRRTSYEDDAVKESDESVHGFDVIIAADTLWNPDTHAVFVETLCKTLKKDTNSRIHLVAGLHTGRYTIQSMLGRLHESGFDVELVEERRVHGDEKRGWSVERAEGEDEAERRRWLVWIVLKWCRA